MPALLIASPAPMAGKTTIAAALAQRLKSQGKSISLNRQGEDEHAVADSAVFATIAAGDGYVVITEDPAGQSAPEGAPVVVVADSATPLDEVVKYANGLGGSVAGVIANRVPQKRLAATRERLQAAGLNVIAAVPEDRVLAAPTLEEVAAALRAEVSHLNGSQMRLVDHPLVSSISADPGQGYFTRHGATTVIVRSDKPDLQLAALSAGASCLIVTGGLPLLSYVLERAEADEIPLLRTALDTVTAIKEIEGLFGSMPFAGGSRKLDRISELLAEVDLPSLVA